VEVRHINRSSSATRQPKVDTGTTVMSQDIEDCLFRLVAQLQLEATARGLGNRAGRGVFENGSIGAAPQLQRVLEATTRSDLAKTRESVHYVLNSDTCAGTTIRLYSMPPRATRTIGPDKEAARRTASLDVKVLSCSSR
jgi:hypothetical protein